MPEGPLSSLTMENSHENPVITRSLAFSVKDIETIISIRRCWLCYNYKVGEFGKIFLYVFAVEYNFSCSYDSYWHVLCSKRFVRDNLQCWVDRDINLGRYKPIFIFQFVVSTTLNAQNVKRNSILAIIYHSSFKTYWEAES